MSTLAEIEAAVLRLSPEHRESLRRFLDHLGSREPSTSLERNAFHRSRRGFPISKGRVPFDSDDVARILAEGELKQ
jgi:hypothetical protein